MKSLGIIFCLLDLKIVAIFDLLHGHTSPFQGKHVNFELQLLLGTLSDGFFCFHGLVFVFEISPHNFHSRQIFASIVDIFEALTVLGVMA